MSNQYNEEWLQAAKENYDQAIAEGNGDLAEAILQDVRDAGFSTEWASVFSFENTKKILGRINEAIYGTNPYTA